MEAASTSSLAATPRSSTSLSVQRANKLFQLPTVCVSGTSSSSSAAPMTADSQGPSDLHAFRVASGGATSAMLHERWFSDVRHQRTSSSSSDSGVAFQFSPPAINSTLGPCPSSASLSISPPGLSPLQLDSAFSTPTPSSGSRFLSHFTFDHLVSPVRRDAPTTTAFDLSSRALAAAAAAAQQQQQQAQAFSELMKHLPQGDDLVASLLAQQQASPQPLKSPVFRSESLPTVGRLPSQADVEKIMQLLTRTPVARTSSLNVSPVGSTGPRPLFPVPSPTAPFASAQSAFHIPVTAKLSEPPPTIHTTAPSPPHRGRRRKQPVLETSLSVDHAALDESKRPYFCNTCNKDFRRPDILSRHLRRHTGEKPFGCDRCGRFFSRSDHLRTHRRTHTNEKPYNCTAPGCSYAARRRDVLTRHMATRHQSKPDKSTMPGRQRGTTTAPQPPAPDLDLDDVAASAEPRPPPTTPQNHPASSDGDDIKLSEERPGEDEDVDVVGTSDDDDTM